MKFDDLFSNCANIYSLKIKQLNDGGASRVIITLLAHRVRRIIALLACYLNLLFSLFKNAFGKRLCRTIKLFIKQQQDRAGKTATSFPGSLILAPRASKERPWFGLVTCYCDN